MLGLGHLLVLGEEGGAVPGLAISELLGGVSIIESEGELIHLLVGLNNLALSHLDVILYVGSLRNGLLKTSSGLGRVSLVSIPSLSDSDLAAADWDLGTLLRSSKRVIDCREC